MATPARETQGTGPNPDQVAMRKAALLQAVTQLDMLLAMFGTAPERVRKAAVEFKEALIEWANS